jgi:hypothetical protein
MPKYSGLSCPTYHVTKCIMQWRMVPRQEWTQLFVYILDTIPISWYIKLKVHRGKGDWEDMAKNLMVTFNFENNNPLIESTLWVLKNNIFASEDLLGSIPLYSMLRVTTTLEEVMHCYNVAKESQYEEDPRKL